MYQEIQDSSHKGEIVPFNKIILLQIQKKIFVIKISGIIFTIYCPLEYVIFFLNISIKDNTFVRSRKIHDMLSWCIDLKNFSSCLCTRMVHVSLYKRIISCNQYLSAKCFCTHISQIFHNFPVKIDIQITYMTTMELNTLLMFGQTMYT